MLTAGSPGCEPTGHAEVPAMLRHRTVPMRAFGDTVIAARPRDGGPVVMVSTAALVWRQLDDWITPGEIDRRLAEEFPAVVGRSSGRGPNRDPEDAAGRRSP